MVLLFGSIYLGLLSALCITDFRLGLLPDRLTLPLLWSGLLHYAIVDPTFLRPAVIGAAAGYLFLWGIYWIWRICRYQEGMGYGDFKLLAALGAWHGWAALPGIVCLAAIAGLVIACVRSFYLPHARTAPICFGPLLIAGALCSDYGPTVFRTAL